MSTTAETPIRAFSATVNDHRGFELEEHCAPYDYSIRAKEHTEPPAALQFEHDVAWFQRAVGRKRDAARSAIVKRLLKEDDPSEFIQTTVRTLVSSARPGRLDDAVDILSECGNLLPQFIFDLLTQPQTKEIGEDEWYPSARMFVGMLWSKSPEAAVEALGDIGDEESLKRLRAVAADDPSEFVRQLAAGIITEYFE